MFKTLYDSGSHKCIGYYNLNVGHGIEANQFLIVDNGHSALLDPGGDLVFGRIREHLESEPTVDRLEYVIASHQDPDIVSSIARWISATDCKVVVPALWERFLPHFCRPTKSLDLDGRTVSVPDPGAEIRLGDSSLLALPAHFLHSEGNIQIYDPRAKILFSGDLGGSVIDGRDDGTPVDDFDAMVPALERFNKRLMVSNAICRYWATMVRGLDIEWIVPQHGPSFKGRENVNRFIEWVENLQCGVDLMTQSDYQIPNAWSEAIRI